jgi:hypothetical protein
MIESSLYEGPIYFNFYPNYFFNHYLIQIFYVDALELNVKTNGYNMIQGSQPLTIVCKIYCKLMKNILEPQALVTTPKGKTLILITK